MVILGNTIAIHIALTKQFPAPMMNFAIRVRLNSKYVTVRAFSLHPILLKNVFLPCVRGTMLGFFQSLIFTALLCDADHVICYINTGIQCVPFVSVEQDEMSDFVGLTKKYPGQRCNNVVWVDYGQMFNLDYVWDCALAAKTSGKCGDSSGRGLIMWSPSPLSITTVRYGDAYAAILRIPTAFLT